jgi:hypothetical protein
MAFTVTFNEIVQAHNGKIITGKYVNTSGSTGGDISFPVCEVLSLTLQPTTTAVVTSFPVVNETLPAAASGATTEITIVTVADTSGYFTAICK